MVTILGSAIGAELPRIGFPKADLGTRRHLASSLNGRKSWLHGWLIGKAAGAGVYAVKGELQVSKECNRDGVSRGELEE
jgi:hypothetical protein